MTIPRAVDHAAVRRIAARLSIAVCCGVVVTAVTRVFAGATCTGVDPPDVPSTCMGLVNSLSVRLGAVVGVVALLATFMEAALLRTAEELDERREQLASRSTVPDTGREPR